MLRELSAGARHQGVVAVARAIERAVTLDDVLADVRSDTLLLVLDQVTDPRNLGACLRVADAAAVDAVVVPRDRSAGLTPAAIKAASGAAESVPLIEVTNLSRTLDDIAAAGIRAIGAAGEADQSLFELQLDGPVAWVVGAEGAGLRRLTREHCAALARIPLQGTVESLNVSVATGICLFETVRQRIAHRAAARDLIGALRGEQHVQHDRGGLWHAVPDLLRPQPAALGRARHAVADARHHFRADPADRRRRRAPGAGPTQAPVPALARWIPRLQLPLQALLLVASDANRTGPARCRTCWFSPSRSAP